MYLAQKTVLFVNHLFLSARQNSIHHNKVLSKLIEQIVNF